MYSIIKKINSRILSFYKGNRFYLWYVLRNERAKQRWIELAPHYRLTNSCIQRKIVVCPYEGKVISGGLADRFRGILSTYYVCKQIGVDFKLHYVHPFNLKDYLEPNGYDWYISKGEVSYQIPKDNILILDSTEDSKYQECQQKHWLINHIKQCQGQIHVYTNASFSYENGYHELFNELFKPSARLAESIEKQRSLIGDRYVSISCRFLNLFGDFNETFGYKEQLTVDERNSLLDKLKLQVEKIHDQYPEYRVLANSDSTTFLEFINKQFPYVYVIPGHITHIDHKKSDGGYDQYEKTFLDFFMIAHAEKIYVLKTGRMHISGYPYAASFVYEKPFEIVRF